MRLGPEGPEGFEFRPHLAIGYVVGAWRQLGQRAPAAAVFADDSQAFQLQAEVLDFFLGRLEAYFAERFPRDVVRAAMGAWAVEREERRLPRTGTLRDLRARIEALAAFREQEGFEDLAVAFKRVFNISKDQAAQAPSPQYLEQRAEPAERALWAAWTERKPAIDEAVGEADYPKALRLVAELRTAVDRFFEEVFVMAEDETVRRTRLGMLAVLRDRLSRIARFEQLGG